MGDSQDAPRVGAGTQTERKAMSADLSMAPRARVPVESPDRNEVTWKDRS
jgi:hypothetical protein